MNEYTKDVIKVSYHCMIVRDDTVGEFRVLLMDMAGLLK